MDKLFITRKRKKWKFAHFNDWPNCWQLAEVDPTVIKKFAGKDELNIEIGAGTGDLSVELARRYPGKKFIATDIKSDRLYIGAKQALAEQLDNVRFLRMNMRELPEAFASNLAESIWVTFPDPFPRKKHAKHRLTHPSFLKMYQELLKPDGKLYFKTDNQALFEWSLEQFENEGWKTKQLSRDLHNSELSEDYKITTKYERRFMSEGLPIYFVCIKA